MITFLEVQKLFLLFLIYSFCGWTIETVGEYIKSKKLVNRGFMIGPLCPVYGVGSVLITIVLNQYTNDIFIIFGISCIMCGILEYFTSLIMEKLFNARWWDYSNFKFNINGRICLEVVALFGLAGIGIIKIFNPLFYKFIINPIPENIINILFYSFVIIFIIDLIVSLNITAKIRKISKQVSSELKDNTEEISKKVRETLLKKSLPYRRILRAFPQVFADKVKSSKEKIVNAASEIKNNVIEVKDKTVDKVNDIKEKTADKVNDIKEKASNNINNIKTNLSQSKSNINERKRKIIESLKGFKLISIKKSKDSKNEK